MDRQVLTEFYAQQNYLAGSIINASGREITSDISQDYTYLVKKVYLCCHYAKKGIFIYKQIKF
jgi:hypothetical protein